LYNRLNEFEPAKDPDADMSCSTIVWFQNENPLFDGFLIKDLVKKYTWLKVSEDGEW